MLRHVAVSTVARDTWGGTAAFLSLAAAPTFAILALLSALPAGGPSDGLCASLHGGSPFTGMPLMYALMAAFHAIPWLRLLSR